ncbi:MTA/SAH nucleosidase isoform X1 [Iris pallida]|uniref:MTA/SAH nucleosidase isoform X1 n=1 Tax=Iris pallida TaxID=29817 RepID=A0AAX6H5G4_IRIPA|nr:MTA/SAH nucleosidase isoform X1 [Iris pallida]
MYAKIEEFAQAFLGKNRRLCCLYLKQVPSISVDQRTPYEIWSSHKPNIQHMQVFGCIAYSHVPDHIRKKLDEKVEKCIFIGYSSVTKGYKLFNPKSGKVIVSRDVTFDEQCEWDWSLDGCKQATYLPAPEDDCSVDEQPVDAPEIQTPAADQSPVAHRQHENVLGRPQRDRRLPSHLQDYEVGTDNDLSDEELVNFALYSDCDPLTFNEACGEEHWRKAIDEEIQAIEKNSTWELTALPEGK